MTLGYYFYIFGHTTNSNKMSWNILFTSANKICYDFITVKVIQEKILFTLEYNNDDISNIYSIATFLLNFQIMY